MDRLVPAAGVLGLLLFSSCSDRARAGEPWLACFDGDTITVADAAVHWSALDAEQREYYLESEDPGEVFVTSLSMMYIFQEYVEREGYTSIPLFQSYRNSWLRTESSLTRREHMRDEILSGLTPEHLQFFSVHLADTVWLSLEADSIPSKEIGFFRLSDIPYPLAVALDSLTEGDALEMESGAGIRLDRIVRGEPASPAGLLAHDGTPDSTAAWLLTEGRLRFLNQFDTFLFTAEFDVSVDTTSVLEVAAYFDGRIDTLATDIVLTSSLLTCTASELASEMTFYQTRLPLRANDPVWAMMTLDNVILQTIRMRELFSTDPAAMDSLEELADRYLVELALDSVYSDSVTGLLLMTPQELEYEYANMDTCLMIPEKRILLALHLPFDREDAWGAAVSTGSQDSYADDLEGLPFLFPDGTVARITGPLTLEDIPLNNREAVFGSPAGDTSFIGPLPSTYIEGFELYRVLEVQPEHPAEMDEIRSQLRSSALIRLEVQRGEEWIAGLKDEYGFTLNDDILDELPADPGLWVSAD